MTKKQRAYQISLLKQLHISDRYTNLYKDDPIAYRAWLKKYLGVDSSKELNISTLKELVDYFNLKRDEPPTNRASSQQINYLKHCWSHHATNKSTDALLKFIKRTLNGDINIDELTPQQAKKVIAGVKKLKPTPYINNPNYIGA